MQNRRFSPIGVKRLTLKGRSCYNCCTMKNNATFLLTRRDLVKGAACAAVGGVFGGCVTPTCGEPTPNYWCTWSTQGKLLKVYKETGEIKFVGDQGIVGIREILNEQVLFRSGAGWARALYPESRADMNILLDDGWDVGLGLDPRRDADKFGSMVLDAGRFPSFTGSPAERLKKLVCAVRDLGWRGLGLWLSPQMSGERWGNLKPADVAYEELRRKIGWCGEAGVSYLKVDWGARDGSVEYRRKMSEFARELAPDMLVEHCRTLGVPLNGVRMVKTNDGKSVEPGCGRWEGDEFFEKEIRPYAEKVLAFCDSFRIYDSVEPLFVTQSVERTQAIMRLAEKAGGGAYVNVEDVPYLGATLGAAIGVMRAPIWPAREGDVVCRGERAGEVTRAFAWQRIAPPFRASAAFPTRRSDAVLTDVWSFRPSDTWFRGVHGKTIPQSAPAMTTRGLDSFPEVDDAGEGVPFVTAMRHPNGALAAGALPRVDAERGYHVPAAHVRFDADAADVPVGAFGRFKSLTLRTHRRPASVHMRDLAGREDHDITAACRVERTGEAFSVAIPGELIEKIGSEAIRDKSDPGVLIRV